jgi:hypothetical protein
MFPLPVSFLSAGPSWDRSNQEVVMAKKSKPVKKSAPKAAKAVATKPPGVIDRIVEVLKAGGGTVEGIAAKVAKHFPDRKLAAVTGTVRVQVTRLARSPEQGGRGLRVKREESDKGFEYSI